MNFRLLAAANSSHSAAQDLIAIVEGPDHHTDSVSNAWSKASGSSTSSSTTPAEAAVDPKEPVYKALLAIILKLAEQQQQQQQPSAEQQQASEQQRLQRLEAFLRSQPLATSIPFISWLADLEAKATGSHKAQLAVLCEGLVVLRETQDQEGQEQLYRDSLALLAAGNEQVSALMASDPRQYALALAEGMTGQPLALAGYSPAVDLLLQVAPPAALTPEAVAQGHQLAAELSQDLSVRRKTTLAAMLGRTRVTAEQQAQLMSGSPAARICDMLLTLSSSEERVGLLPDCFTPPDDAAADDADDGDDAAGSAGSSSNAAAAADDGGDGEEGQLQETEELWCTPMQLLNEIDRRLKTAAGAAAQPADCSGSGDHALPAAAISGRQQQQHAALPPGGSSDDAVGGMLTGAAAAAALLELKQHIEAAWLASLPQQPPQQQQQQH